MELMQTIGHITSKEDLEERKMTLQYSGELKAHNNYSLIMVDRSMDNYNKNLNLGLLALCSQCFQSASLNKKEYNSNITNENITLTQAELYRQLSRFLGYMSNCHSYNNEENTILDFDKEELLSRLERIKQSINSL